MSIRKRGRRYQAQVKAHQEVVASRTFDTLAAAKAWHDAEVLKYKDSSYSIQLGKAKATDVIAQWLPARKPQVAESTYATDKQVVSMLPDSLTGKQVRAITTADLQRLVNMWAATRKPSTVTRYADSVKAFFAWCVRRGFVAQNPVVKVDIPKRRKEPRPMRPLDENELTTLAEGVGGIYGDAIAILGFSGMRWGEARALRVGDVLLGDEFPRFHVVRSQPEGKAEKLPKSYRGRMVPIGPQIEQRVKGLMEGRGKDDYLLSRDGESQLWRSRFVRATGWAEAADGRTIHDLRHSAAVNWLRRGVPAHTVQAWLGHSDLAMTTRYTSFLGMDIDQAAFAKLGG
ncbi:MAG: tyrosine-type recombinase/integrase [Bifidobacteriaceae bacterium]|jgi:integrase|nr:tyrosine-type recombinase/integrase [Bifidobacteriaceae bacterium]